MTKLKTELCKNWMNTGSCRFIETCAFAHGSAELKKKTHVGAKYKLEKCESYHKAPFFCIYGERCQFMHTQREQVQGSSQLLTENVYQFNCRTSNVEDPELNAFNVANTDSKRLSVFENIVDSSEQKRTRSRHCSNNKKRKAKGKKAANDCFLNQAITLG